MDKEKPLVSIITVNYNQEKVTCELLQSIHKLNYPNYEVIVVDNASKENPTKAVSIIFPEAKITLSKENIGFAGGNNLGIKAAKGDYLFFVNNDTEVTPDIIENILDVFKQLPDAGAVSPKIYYYGHERLIQYAGYTKINPYTARNTTIGQFQKDEKQFDELKETPYAHGAAMMVSRKALNKAGMMPEVFFLYYEELDWSEQIKRAGFKIYYQPKAIIYHKESVSVGESSPLKTYYLSRNRILFMRRNASKIHLLVFSFFLMTFTIPKNVLLFILKGKFEHLRAFLKGVAWHLQHNAYSNKTELLSVKAELKNI